MNKQKVVLASVLKPIDDTRMFRKMGYSLATTGLYNVNIIGFKAKPPIGISNISFHPIFEFNRISFSRLICGIRYYKQPKKLRPELIIITTHELIWPSIIYKLIYRAKLIYDVQENHFRNILFTNSFPLLIRPILACWVRSKEYIFSLFFNQFFLAEKYYKNELNFIGNRAVVIENKALEVAQNNRLVSSNLNEKIRLIFSGTLAESTGVFDAINLAKKLYRINNNIRLIIIGYSPKKSVISKIESLIKTDDFIELKGGNSLVNHSSILEAIGASDFGIINYPHNKSTINSTPTKLYEYLSMELPIIVQPHPEWASICAPYDAHLTVDFNDLQPELLLEKMLSTTLQRIGSYFQI